ncbi:hypothetical protein NKG05_27880 [Oerskovia sp. M15]
MGDLRRRAASCRDRGDPGAEPVAEGGYAAALLLDAALSTAHVGLAVAQDALHRWLAAAGLVRSAREGGQVLLVGTRPGADQRPRALGPGRVRGP